MTTLQLGPALSACRWTRRQHGIRLRRRGVVLRRRRRPDSLPRHGLIMEVLLEVVSSCQRQHRHPYVSIFTVVTPCRSDITDDRVTTSYVFVKLRDPTPPTRLSVFPALPPSYQLRFDCRFAV